MSRDGEKMPAPPPRSSGISGAGGSQPHNDSIRKDGKECK